MPWAGGAPISNEYRCEVILRTGLRCNKWAKKDPTTGKSCGRCTVHLRNVPSTQLKVPLAFMPKFYRHTLTKTLQSVVEEHLRLSNAEQIQLYEELALLRHNAGLAVEQYGKAYDMLLQARASQKQDLIALAEETLLEAAEAMKSQLREVRDTCKTIAEIEAKATNNITVFTLHGVVRQMVFLLYETLGPDNMELAHQFEEMVRRDVVLPASEVKGTTITPDQEVLAMDATVPFAAPDETDEVDL